MTKKEEDEFEKALMALNLDELPATKRREESNQEVAIVKNGDKIGVDDGGESEKETDIGLLSDDALLAAMSANPELFP